MARNFVQPGDRLLYANTGATVIASGAPVMFGSLLGVAYNDIEPGASGPVGLVGVWRLPCSLTADVDAGDALYFHAATGVITDSSTTDSTDNPMVGVAAAAARSDAASVDVRLAG